MYDSEWAAIKKGIFSCSFHKRYCNWHVHFTNADTSSSDYFQQINIFLRSHYHHRIMYFHPFDSGFVLQNLKYFLKWGNHRRFVFLFVPFFIPFYCFWSGYLLHSNVSQRLNKNIEKFFRMKFAMAKRRAAYRRYAHSFFSLSDFFCSFTRICFFFTKFLFLLQKSVFLLFIIWQVNVKRPRIAFKCSKRRKRSGKYIYAKEKCICSYAKYKNVLRKWNERERTQRKKNTPVQM